LHCAQGSSVTVPRLEKKPDFLAELVRTCDNETLPLLLGGDFNILRRKEDTNNDNFNGRWPFMFNAIIESLDLREISLSERQYTVYYTLGQTDVKNQLLRS
jgi:exonuclease III